MPAHVFTVAGRSLVAGLVWRTLSQPTAALRREAMKEARLLRPVRIYAPVGARTIGFLARADLGKQKLGLRSFSAASLFAALPNIPRTALLALPLPAEQGRTAEHAAIIAISDGQPLPDFDRVVPIDSASETAYHLRLQLERALSETPSIYGSILLESTPITWEEIAAAAAPRLTRASSSSSLPLTAAAVGLLLLGASEAVSWWRQEQARKAAIEAAARKVDPNVAYEQSAREALQQQVWTTRDELKRIVTSVGALPTDLAGFELDIGAGVDCQLATVQCSASYRRRELVPTSYNDVAAAAARLPWKTAIHYGIDGTTVVVAFTAFDRTPAPAPTRDSLPLESDVPLKFWPAVHALETVSVTASLSQPSAVVGAIPRDATEASIRKLVRTWPVSIKAPAWGADLVPLPTGLSLERAVVRLNPPVIELTGKIHAVKN